MALYSTLAALSQVAASNAADGTTDAPSTIDNNMNLLASFIARSRDGDLNTPFGSVASASTTVLDGAVGSVAITGTTTINAITLAEGSVKRVRFAAALTLTHGASLVMPASRSVTTGAGDYATFVGRSGGVVECIGYQCASQSITANGYYKLPGGLVVQWGSVTTTITGAAATYPLVFPNAILVFLPTVTVPGSAGAFATNLSPTASAAYVQTWTSTTTQVASLVNWIALGY